MDVGVLMSTMVDVEILLTVCHLCVAFELGIAQDDRVIDETPLTVKVISGSTAILPCSVDPKYTEGYADQYSVLWQNPIQTVISVKDRRVLTDMRISVERPFVSDWNLHIRNVSVTDSGEYKCQINTDPVRSKRVKLVVQVPPNIIDYSDSDDVKARTGDNVELMCNATGIPTPTITWYRLNVWSTKKKEKVGHEGQVLLIRNISRVCADTYECVANNTVPPARTRQIKVTVEYPPEIHLFTTRIGQQLRRETILECRITASPLGVTMWKKNGEQLHPNFKHELDVYNEGPQTITLSLRIVNIQKHDFGEYVCEASNSMGSASEVMELYEVYPITTTTTPPTTTQLIRQTIYFSGEGGKEYPPPKTWPKGDRGKHREGTFPGTKTPKSGTTVKKNPTGVYGTGSVKYDNQAGTFNIPTAVVFLCVMYSITLVQAMNTL
ncbi:lachesin-like isoform X1 [Haliotis asinina]|uniref:lachesin-like isoform X1 n=1 Tax=Haliotis asinina TaxID=109174 RepID=UPI003531BBD5